MPYKRKQYKKKKSKRVSPYTAAKKVINSLAEHKYTDDTVATYMLSSGAITNVSAISQGDDNSQRQGSNVVPQSYAMRFSIECTTSVAARLILFQDVASNGTAPSVTDVLATADFRSYKNDNNKMRFKFLWDKLFNFHNYNTSNSSAMVFKSMYKRLPNKRMTFADSATTPEQNAIYLLMISDIGTNVCYLSLRSRLRFLDL